LEKFFIIVKKVVFLPIEMFGWDVPYVLIGSGIDFD
jgi:hypothetical protein